MKAPLLPHPITRRALLEGLAASALTIPLPACAHEQAARRRFRIFDATAYAGRPDLSRWGIEPIHVVDRGIWADERGPAGFADPGLVRAYVQGLPSDGAPIVMDFEMYPQHGELSVQRDSLARLSRIARTFRAAGSQRQLGFFGVLPIAENNRPQLPPGSQGYGDWQRDNDVFAPIEGLVDCLLPSLYTGQPEREIWVTLATAVLREARRLSDKPVYGFLWPEYSDHHPTLRGQFLERDFWQLQLRTLLQHADGIVIWGGIDIPNADRRRPWDERAPWWEATKRFAIDANIVL